MADAATKSKFTPGPWEVMPIRLYLGRAEAYDIVHGDDHQILVNDVAGEADAHLIAAAPELLEALRLARRTITSFMVPMTGTMAAAIFDDIDSVIAKAEGRDS